MPRLAPPAHESSRLGEDDLGSPEQRQLSTGQVLVRYQTERQREFDLNFL